MVVRRSMFFRNVSLTMRSTSRTTSVDLHLHAPSLHAAGEGQHLLDHVGAAAGAALERGQDVEAFLVALVLAQHPDRDHDRREDVVEVVRDAAGQRADALQALRAQELLLAASSAR